jgi:pyruvate formate-lyase activating enzyme-like uncharacterized protein
MEMAESEAEAAEATTAKFMNAQEATQTAIKFLRSLGYQTAKPNKSSSDGEKATVELELKRKEHPWSLTGRPGKSSSTIPKKRSNVAAADQCH